MNMWRQLCFSDLYFISASEIKRIDSSTKGGFPIFLNMKLERTFIVNQPDLVVNERIRSFMSAAGYREVSRSPIMYQRGSFFGTLTALRPNKWAALALVETAAGEAQTQVTLKVDVNTTGHMIVLQKEVDYWQSEIESFEQGVISGEIRAESLHRSANELKSSIFKGALVFLLVALVVGIPLGILGKLFLPFRSNFGLVIGIIAGLAAAGKYWGNKKSARS
jgi:hypothetical protein